MYKGKDLHSTFEERNIKKLWISFQTTTGSVDTVKKFGESHTGDE